MKEQPTCGSVLQQTQKRALLCAAASLPQQHLEWNQDVSPSPSVSWTGEVGKSGREVLSTPDDKRDVQHNFSF
jgi:hypothetical protein